MASEPGVGGDWVTTLPSGPECSVGYSDNKTVKQDGSTSRRKDNEDRYYTCHFQDRLQLYMVLDGHDGTKAVEFARTEIPRLLLEQKISAGGGGREEVLEALNDTIVKTEQNFFTRIDSHITRMISLQLEIEQSDPKINSATAARLFPAQIAEIGRLSELIKGGTTLVAALIQEEKLYVANVGDSRALLCSQDSDGSVIKVEQISVDHNTRNEEELRRLAGCGLDLKKLRLSGRLGMQQNTRSIGDYSIKGGYKSVDVLSHATSQPGTAEPYLHGPTDLSAFHGFLVLMSDGLCDAYEAWTRRPDRINEDIANLIAGELTNISNFETIAQNIVEKVKCMYCETCKRYRRSGRMDDITLIIRRIRPHDKANTTACVAGVNGVTDVAGVNGVTDVAGVNGVTDVTSVNGISSAYHEHYMRTEYQTQSLFAGERCRAHTSGSDSLLAFGEEQLSSPLRPPRPRHASNPIFPYEPNAPLSRTSEPLYINIPLKLRERGEGEISSTLSLDRVPTSLTYPSKPHPPHQRLSTSCSLSPMTSCPDKLAKTEEEEEEELMMMYGWTTEPVGTPDGPHVKPVDNPAHHLVSISTEQEK